MSIKLGTFDYGEYIRGNMTDGIRDHEMSLSNTPADDDGVPRMEYDEFPSKNKGRAVRSHYNRCQLFILTIDENIGTFPRPCRFRRQ